MNTRANTLRLPSSVGTFLGRLDVLLLIVGITHLLAYAGAQVHGPRTTEESFRYRGLPVLADMVAEAVRGSDALHLYRAHHVVTPVCSTCPSTCVHFHLADISFACCPVCPPQVSIRRWWSEGRAAWISAVIRGTWQACGGAPRVTVAVSDRPFS